jgi:hypothetical protein
MVVLFLVPIGALGEQPAATRGPLSESEVVYLLQAGVTTMRVRTLVEQHGVTFHPSSSSVDMLRAAGADEILIRAITDSYREGGPTPADTPLSVAPPAHPLGSPSGEARPPRAAASDADFVLLSDAPRGPIEMARTEVTNREFDAFVRAMGVKRPSTPFWGSPNSYPVVNVTWHDAVAYCRWLTLTTGRRHRLPYEVEWEYAARGGLSLKIYPWGDAVPDGRACFARRGPCPVRSFRPNAFGLYDMAGSVSEWCQDRFEAGGKARVVRGGGWTVPAGSPLDLAVARREKANPDRGKNDIGFRVVRLP